VVGGQGGRDNWSSIKERKGKTDLGGVLRTEENLRRKEEIGAGEGSWTQDLRKDRDYNHPFLNKYLQTETEKGEKQAVTRGKQAD